jgi:hypothetical protein
MWIHPSRRACCSLTAASASVWACNPHERNSSATSARSPDDTGVRTCPTTAEEGRGAVRRTKESHRSSSPALAQAEVRPRAVLPGGHCPKHQTIGPVPLPNNDTTDTCHCIGTKKGLPTKSAAGFKPQNAQNRHRLFQHPQAESLIEAKVRSLSDSAISQREEQPFWFATRTRHHDDLLVASNQGLRLEHFVPRCLFF